MSVPNTFFKRLRGLVLSAACLALAGVLIAGYATPKVYADEWNKMTKLTFSEAVQVPGQVLQPGTYMFKLLDNQSDRHIVQIFDESGQHLITTVMAIPDYRLQAKGKTVVRFDERASDQPQAIKEWFYPGDLAGQEFVYPKGETLHVQVAERTNPFQPPAEVAQNNEPVAPAEPGTNETMNTPAEPAPFVDETETTPEPTPDVVPEPAPSVTPDQDKSKDIDQDKVKPSDDESKQLPKTGSELPLIAAFGSSALGLATMLRSYRRRNK